VLLRPGSDEAAAARVAGRLLAALERDIVLDGVSIQVDGSIGIALAPGHAADASGLLQRADIAMYDAKRADLRWQLYDAARDRHARDRLALTGDLRRALGTDQLVLHYQPQADLASGQITGVEALVRWQHPTRGLLGPCQFIPLAEENGLMRPFTLHVLGSALRQARAWRDIGLRLRVAINISAHNLLDRELPNDVRALLDEHDLDPAALQLEITESAVMADPARAADVLSRLRELGVSVALDDFGTGHASLARLRHLAVDELKIDRSFVNDLAHPGHAAIVRAIVDLAHSLNLRVVAEGVEDADTWTTLADLRCDDAQGYHLARPQHADTLTGWLADRQPTTSPIAPPIPTH
jgi:EAL domain-containing protein (putative c-di-GMP-specific phosphodiesterase class I)